jgi:hypothetical protein
MAQTAAQGKPVRIESTWFGSGYARGVSGAMGMPSESSEQAVLSVARRILAIYCDDGEISEEQLRYECGLLTGYLVSTIGQGVECATGTAGTA